MGKNSSENRDGAKVGDILEESFTGEDWQEHTFYQIVALRGTTQIAMKALNHSIIAFDDVKKQVIPVPDSTDPDTEGVIGRTERLSDGSYCVKFYGKRAYLYDPEHEVCYDYNYRWVGPESIMGKRMEGFSFDLRNGTGFFSPDGKTCISRDLPIEVRYPDDSVQKLTIRELEDGRVSLEGAKRLPYYKWISKWLFCDSDANLILRQDLTWENLVDWIFSAPGKTIYNKRIDIEHIPYSEEDNGKKERCLAYMGDVYGRVTSGIASFEYYYEVEIRKYGVRCPFQEKILFSNAKSAARFVADQIDAIAESDGAGAKKSNRYYGAIYEYHVKTNKRFVNEWNLIANSQGKIIYYLPAFHKKEPDPESAIGMTDMSYIRLNYPSGTIVEIKENPFFKPVKGVILNKTEPMERGFIQESHNQWLICADHAAPGHTCPLQAVELGDDRFLSAFFGSDFPLPFRRFLECHTGELTPEEARLGEISQFIKHDKKGFWERLEGIAEIVEGDTAIERFCDKKSRVPSGNSGGGKGDRGGSADTGCGKDTR